MIANDQSLTVQVYGVFKHPAPLSLQIPKNQLIEGNTIHIKQHTYLIASVVLQDQQVAINLNLQLEFR